MIAPEKPPLRMAKRTSSRWTLRWLKLGPFVRSPPWSWPGGFEPYASAEESEWQPLQRSMNSTAPWRRSGRSLDTVTFPPAPEVTAAFTSRKLSQVPAEFGDGLVVRAARVPEILPLAERVVRHFGFRGMADIEFKLDPRTGDYRLLDINPRPWLWINLPTACGVNLVYAAYLDATGQTLDRKDFVQRDFEMRWVSARGVANALVRSLLSGRPLAHIRTLAGQLRGRRVGPLYARRDALFRMFLNPAYWWASLRQSIQGVWGLHHALSHGAVAEGSR